MKIKQRIKDLPLASRPREKLFSLGSTNLSEAELLAILLSTGRKGQNVVALSEALLKKYPLSTMSTVSLAELSKTPGIGKTKASRIVAALELGERAFAPASFTKVVLRSTDDVLAQLRDIAVKRQEYLLVFYLNARYELIQKETVGIGSLNSLNITPKEIFSPALQTPCAFIIVAHNHPSGDPTPSDADIRFTTTLHEAGEVMRIPLLDHVIVSKSGSFSFKDNE